jgi:DNA-binding transcriptional regulator GbsR (MarR family)
MIHIIDNKRIAMTNDEFALYKKICASYDRTNFDGTELFRDHFEVNDGGIIIFVKPPHQKYSSLEVFCFLISIMVNQHIRINHEQTDALVRESTAAVTAKVKELQEQLDKIKELTNNLKQIDELKAQIKQIEELKDKTEDILKVVEKPSEASA